MRRDEYKRVAERVPARAVPEKPAQAWKVLEDRDPGLLEAFDFGGKSANNRRLPVG